MAHSLAFFPTAGHFVKFLTKTRSVIDESVELRLLIEVLLTFQNTGLGIDDLLKFLIGSEKNPENLIHLFEKINPTKGVPKLPPSLPADVQQEVLKNSKVIKGNLKCSHGKFACLHLFGKNTCIMVQQCNFCHESHPPPEQEELLKNAKEEYARRHSMKLNPLPQTVQSITFGDFIDWLKQETFIIIYMFNSKLKLLCGGSVEETSQDIRVYLNSINRNPNVITDKFPLYKEGLTSGIEIFKIHAHSEPVAEEKFKDMVKKYLQFITSVISFDNSVNVKSYDVNKILQKLNSVIFPEGMTYSLAIVPKTVDLVEPRAVVAPNYRRPTPLVRRPDLPAVNVRELHRQGRCQPCRHYLRGMCFLGDGACNYCHDPSHQFEIEYVGN